MKYLRILSFLVGAAIMLFMVPVSIMAGAMTFLSDSDIPESSTSVTLWVLGFVAIVTSGFFLIGVYGKRIIRSVWLRVVTAILLAIPILITGITLFFSNHREVEPVFAPLLILSVFLFSAFVWPAWLERNAPPVNSSVER